VQNRVLQFHNNREEFLWMSGKYTARNITWSLDVNNVLG
jgi:hypothetical protein